MEFREFYSINKQYPVKRVQLLLIVITNLCTILSVVVGNVIVAMELSVIVALFVSTVPLRKARLGLASVNTLSLLLLVSVFVLFTALASRVVVL